MSQRLRLHRRADVSYSTRPMWAGRSMAKTVPLRLGFVLLRTCSIPSCFETVFLTSGSPKPVPAAPLGVKKSSNILGKFSSAIPAR
jgi:hypothetical protein